MYATNFPFLLLSVPIHCSLPTPCQRTDARAPNHHHSFAVAARLHSMVHLIIAINVLHCRIACCSNIASGCRIGLLIRPPTQCSTSKVLPIHAITGVIIVTCMCQVAGIIT